MTDPSSLASAAISRRWRRGCTIVLLVLLLPVLVLAGLYVRFAIKATHELRDAIAEADQLDPRWRLSEMEADRAVIPEEKNSAEKILAIKPLLPAEDAKDEAKRTALEASLANLDLQRQLNEEQVEALRAKLKRAATALAKARKLVDMPEGRYPLAYAADFISTLLPHVDLVRQIANLLAYDAMMRAQEDDADGALASCRAALNAGRSLGDEPIAITQLVRISMRAKAVDKVRRTLAQGQPSEAALRQIQQLLEKEEAEPLLLRAMRGERAGWDHFLEALQTGKIKLSGDDLLRDLRIIAERQPTSRELRALQSSTSIKSQRAAMLRFMTRTVEIAKLPPGPKQQREMEQLEASEKNQPLMVQIFLPAIEKLSSACLRDRVELRCAIAAVAAERYRRDKKNWPDNLETLRESGYLKQVPIDVYDDQPLRMRRLEDGLMIYSVGPDGRDNDGHIDRTNPLAEGSDRGFRLWDAAKRRQPGSARN
ncbi:MAG TPA: hypothetical protein VN688_33240 [Gemmataceae bacterium]|nr:hypothetical protein [Gemmataceae bacterium]